MPVRPGDHKELVLPPGFCAVEIAQPWHAALHAAADTAPGTVMHAPLDGMLDAAIILTPDRPVQDQTVMQLGTLAVLDAIIAALPPKTTVAAGRAGTIAVNGGDVASIRMARGLPHPDGVPSWLVLGLTIRVALRLDAPGLTPWQTDLAEEGADITSAALLPDICRHLLGAIDLWLDAGAAGIERAWHAAALQPA
jgi:hypothetical protein